MSLTEEQRAELRRRCELAQLARCTITSVDVGHILALVEENERLSDAQRNGMTVIAAELMAIEEVQHAPDMNDNERIIAAMAQRAQHIRRALERHTSSSVNSKEK
jgi:hypothetical protein